MISIVATIPVRADKVAEFEDISRALAAAVKANEPGCVLYSMGRCRTDPLTYRNLEIFRDQAALDAHLAADHFKRIAPQMGKCLSAPAAVEFMDTVA